ncbi:MAG: WYL domain-containing protein [Actinomycetes bacterium]
MSESALDRTARALDLIPFIAENPGLSIEDLAREFDTTPKSLTKDLDLLFVCGLPGYTPLELIDLSYESGYVSVIDAQSLDRPRQLSRKEIQALVLGLEVLMGLREEYVVEIAALRDKLVSVLSTSELPIRIEPTLDAGTGFLGEVERAIAGRRLLEIDYQGVAKDALTHRVVRPDSISHLNGLIYLSGWCFLSSGYRTFRIDRISALKVFDADETRYRASDVATAVDSITEVTLEVSPSARVFFEENASIIDMVEAHGEGVRVRVHVSDPEWILRTCLGFGPKVRILEPASLAQALLDRVRLTLEQYSLPKSNEE